VAALLLWTGFSADADDAIEWFGAVRTANGKGVTIPSQVRWIYYFDRVVRLGGLPEPVVLLLDLVRLRGVPVSDSAAGGSCVPTFDIECNGVRVFDWAHESNAAADDAGVALSSESTVDRVAGADATSGRRGTGADSDDAIEGAGVDCDDNVNGVKKLTRFRRGEPYFDFPCTGLGVHCQGNVKVTFYADGAARKKLMCHIWFHSAFVEKGFLLFHRNMIDGAAEGQWNRTSVRFPDNFAIEVFAHRQQ
jgi:hypothetical protein